MLNLVRKGSGLLHIYADDLFGTHLVGAGSCVHACVAAANDNDVVSHLRLFACIDCLHEINACHDALSTRPVEDTRNVSACSNNDCVKARTYFLELLRIHVDAVCKLDAHLGNALDLVVQKRLVQALAGDDLLHLAAHAPFPLENSDLVPLACKAPGSGKAAHATANDGDLLSCLCLGPCKLHVLRGPAQGTNLYGAVKASPCTGLHAGIWTNTSAHAAWEGRVVEDKAQGLLALSLAQEVVAQLCGDACRTGVLAGSAVRAVFPFGHAQPPDTVGHKAVVFACVREDVRENAAWHPLVLVVVGNRGKRSLLSVFVSGRNNLVPLLPDREFLHALLLVHCGQEVLKAALQEEHIVPVYVHKKHVRRQGSHGTSHVDNTAHHANARAIAKDRRQCLAVAAADNGAATTHEFEGEASCAFQNPQFRLFVERVVLHEGA